MTSLRRRILLACCFAATAAAPGVALMAADDPKPAGKESVDPAPKPTPADRAKAAGEAYTPLLGDWELTGGSANGAAVNPQSPLFPGRVQFQGPTKYVAPVRFFFRQATINDGPDERFEDARYAVNTRRTPHELTVATPGGLGRSDTSRLIAYVYEVTGERLRVAYYDDRYCADRPHGFAAADQPAGSPPLVVLEYRLLKRPDPQQPRPRAANPFGPGGPGTDRNPGGAGGRGTGSRPTDRSGPGAPNE